MSKVHKERWAALKKHRLQDINTQHHQSVLENFQLTEESNTRFAELGSQMMHSEEQGNNQNFKNLINLEKIKDDAQSHFSNGSDFSNGSEIYKTSEKKSQSQLSDASHSSENSLGTIRAAGRFLNNKENEKSPSHYSHRSM